MVAWRARTRPHSLGGEARRGGIECEPAFSTVSDETSLRQATLDATITVLRRDRDGLMRALASVMQDRHRLVEEKTHLERRLAERNEVMLQQNERIDLLEQELRRLDEQAPARSNPRAMPGSLPHNDMPARVRELFLRDGGVEKQKSGKVDEPL